MKYKEVVISSETIPSLPEELPVGTQIFVYDKFKGNRWSHFTAGVRKYLAEGTPRDHLYDYTWEDVKIRILLEGIDSSDYWASQYCSTDELNTWIKDKKKDKPNPNMIPLNKYNVGFVDVKTVRYNTDWDDRPSEPTKTPDAGEYLRTLYYFGDEAAKYNNKHRSLQNKDIKVGDRVVCKDSSYTLEVSNGEIKSESPALKKGVLKVLVTNGVLPACSSVTGTGNANDLMCVYEDDPNRYLFVNSHLVVKLD